MPSDEAIALVEELYSFRSPLRNPDDISAEIRLFGLTLADVEQDYDIVFELGIAKNIRKACEALGIEVTSHQSLTLAKHMTVGAERYRNGVPLSDRERDIAVRLATLHMEANCRKEGVPFTDELREDCKRQVQFGERGLHIGHKVGEASGCFQVLLILGFAAASLISASIVLFVMVQ